MTTKKTELENYIWVDLDQLVKAPWNYKEEDEQTSIKLAANMRRSGQMVNLVVRELGQETADGRPLYEVGDGNHRVDALFINKAKGAVVYNCGSISVEELQRRAIEVNETRFASEPIRKAQLVEALVEKFGIENLTETMPYSADQIQDMIDLANWDPDDLGGDGSEPTGDEDWKTVTCRMPESAHNVFLKAHNEMAKTTTLHDKEGIANGQCLELLSANYLA